MDFSKNLYFSELKGILINRISGFTISEVSPRLAAILKFDHFQAETFSP